MMKKKQLEVGQKERKKRSEKNVTEIRVLREKVNKEKNNGFEKERAKVDK